jgi:predicted HicB family RNase H-like nuclease
LARAVAGFLKDCKGQAMRPEKPAPGKPMLRVPPEVHGAALVAAEAAGKSLNQWATEILEEAVQN